MPDVARRAGVSTATVDRVLNRRPGVRSATARRVLGAAAALGYIAEADYADAAPAASLRLVFLLPAGSNRFLAMLGRLVGGSEAPLAALGVRCRVETVEGFHPERLARDLLRHGRNADGVAFMALEHPAVREAVNALAARGVPCVTLISDVANSRRAGYVGLDNRAAGRTAADLIARFLGGRPAKVAMIAGSLSYRAHEEREMGFLSLFQERYPQVEVVGLREGRDDEARNHRHARALLAQHPDLAGIYNIGGGPEGVARALVEVRGGKDVVFVGHGLTPGTRALLVEGVMDAVITQNPQATITSCVTILKNVRAGVEPGLGVEPPRCEIVLRENLP